ncbi:MAG: class I SAM-dependent methyltransferase [Trueperaceae bacterium]|nr:class I SAM-dependent methyltransferase [Trueperaceae bacterium]
MSRTRDQAYLVGEQYKNADNLRARIDLHERFSSNKEVFARWLFDQIIAPPEAKVLELGTGPAHFWRKNSERIPQGWQITLSDLSPGMLEEAKKVGSSLMADFDYKLIDAQTIPFADAHFDLVIANHMLYHVPDLDKAIAEIRRVLKPGGKLYAATNGQDHMKELDQFILEHLKPKLDSEQPFELLQGLSFRLENGKETLQKQFDNVELYPFDDHLEVTEAEPFLAYIYSMNRLQSIVLDQALLAKVMQEAKVALDQKLELGPIYVTKSTGLFAAF